MKRALLFGVALIVVAAVAFAVMGALGYNGSAAPSSAWTETGTGTILIQGAWGDAPGEFGLREEHEFWGPRAFAVDPQGYVYVADSINRRLQLFDDSGQFVAAFPYPKSGDIEDLAVRPDGVVFVIDSGHAVGFLNPDDTEIKWADRGDLQRTKTFRIRPTELGNIYIEEQGADDVEHLVRKYNAADDLCYLATLNFRDLCLRPYSDMAYGIAADAGTARSRQITVAAYNFGTMKWEATPLQVDAVGSETLSEGQARLIGVDGQFRPCLLVMGDPEQGVAPRVLHYSRDGALRGTTWLDILSDTDVDLGGDIHQVVVDPGGKLYVATAKAEEGFQIWKLPAR
jgi:DNA-binding beta-propeller fold protein YncE